MSSFLFAEITDQEFRSDFVGGLAESLKQQGFHDVEAVYISGCTLFGLETKYSKKDLINASPSLADDSKKAMKYCYRKMMQLKSRK
jgi:hypothetical protein